MNNITEPNAYYCSGCGACAAICPNNAITLRKNGRGFFEAFVEEANCVECGICRKVCMRFDQTLSGVNIQSSHLYAVQSKDTETVKRCSSGGAAHEIASWGLSHGYKLCGAVYDTVTDIVYHQIADSSDALDGSKYLQSNASIFVDVIKQAKRGQHLIVFGTPCQIAGLAKASKRSGVRDMLLLVEIFCHGVPSYKLWEKECHEVRKKLHCEHFDNVQFRYKKNGWHSYCLRFQAGGKVYYGSREGDLFYRAFFDDIFLNDSCMNCRMRKEQSLADIRLGDYWGKRYAARDDGVSAVFCNTEFGENVIAACNLIMLEPGTAEEQLSCQNMEGYTCQALQRSTMSVLEQSGIDKAIRCYKSGLPIKRKLKNIALSVVAVLPDGIRAKVRKMR